MIDQNIVREDTTAVTPPTIVDGVQTTLRFLSRTTAVCSFLRLIAPFSPYLCPVTTHAFRDFSFSFPIASLVSYPSSGCGRPPYASITLKTFMKFVSSYVINTVRAFHSLLMSEEIHSANRPRRRRCEPPTPNSSSQSNVPIPKRRATTSCLGTPLKVRGFVVGDSEGRRDPSRCPREQRAPVYRAMVH